MKVQKKKSLKKKKTVSASEPSIEEQEKEKQEETKTLKVVPEEAVVVSVPKTKKNWMAPRPTSAGGYAPGALGSFFNKEETSEPAESWSWAAESSKSEATSVEADEKEVQENDEANIDETETKTKRDRTQQRENRKKKDSPKQEAAKTIFLGNMPITATTKSVRKMFFSCGYCESARVRGAIPDKESISKRVAMLSGRLHERQTSLSFYVKFRDVESVENALKMNGQIIDGHRIRVDRSDSKGRLQQESSIFVGNLPFDVSEDKLGDFFSTEIGEVVNVRVVRDAQTGLGKGFAFVNFKDDVSVSMALAMPELKFNGRMVRVSAIKKKAAVAKQAERQKVAAKAQRQREKKRPSKIDKFKFSTYKQPSAKTDDGKTILKKSAKKAIMKKKQSKQSKSLMT